MLAGGVAPGGTADSTGIPLPRKRKVFLPASTLIAASGLAPPAPSGLLIY
jgi:hypothetical protein